MFLYGTIYIPLAQSPLLMNQKKIGSFVSGLFKFFFQNWLDLVMSLFCVQVNRYTSSLAL